MKIFFSLVFVCCISVSFAGERKSLPQGNYVVISDEYSSLLKPGECLVRGKIHNPNYYSDDQKAPAITGAYIGTLDKKRFAYSNDKGEYSLILHEGDTSIYMFAQGYDEVIIWKYAFKSQHVVNIDFYAYDNYNMIEVDKPVIYCYSEEEIKVELKIEPKGAFTFTYPPYKDGWSVKVDDKGISDGVTGKNYPYLFWEAQTNELDFIFSENKLMAEIILTDTVIAYLENSLQAMGLNETEKTDFITYWAPRMIENEYVLVQFIFNETYQSAISEMEITPAPNSMFRLFMMYAPVETDHAPFVLQSVKYESFERSGFTVVEWGGSELPPVLINP